VYMLLYLSIGHEKYTNCRVTTPVWKGTEGFLITRDRLPRRLSFTAEFLIIYEHWRNL
jgi:hypothetical protein